MNTKVETPQGCASPVIVTVFGQAFTWTPDDGLDPAVVEAVRLWIYKQANKLRYAATRVGLSQEDLVQEGLLGALEAARTFAPWKGAGFHHWASYSIRGRMLSVLMEAEVHVPSGSWWALHRAGGLPSVCSLDAPITPGGASLGDMVATEPEPEAYSHTETEALRAEVWKALRAIPRDEATVLRRFYGIGVPAAETHGELTRALGCSYDSLNHTLSRARFSLRKALAKAKLTTARNG